MLLEEGIAMSIGPMGFIGGIAAAPLAQAQGSEVDRAAEESAGQSRQVASEVKAELTEDR